MDKGVRDMEKTKPNSPNRRISLYILATMFSLLLTLVMGEVLVRLFLIPQTLPKPPPPEAIDPYQTNLYFAGLRPWIFFHLPGSRYTQARSYYRVQYAINSLGFRGPEILTKQENGLKRLLVVGDSIVEGHGNEFEQTFTALLEKRLHEYGWEAINVGCQGASPIYYAANLERYLSLQPDAILLLIFENDLRDDRVIESSFFDIPWMDDEYTLIMNGNSFAPWRQSKLYVLLRNTFKKLWHSPLEQIVARNQQIPIINEEQKALQKISDYLIASSLFDTQWKMSEAYLDYIAQTLDQRGVRLLVANLSIIGLGTNLPKPHSEHAWRLDQRVTEWSQQKKLPFLSLLPYIEQVWKERPAQAIVIENDGHPTPETHKLIADALLPWINNSLK